LTDCGLRQSRCFSHVPFLSGEGLRNNESAKNQAQ
jgi:hypothetical protein